MSDTGVAIDNDPGMADVLALHRMLFPEQYPRELQPDHAYWAGWTPDEAEDWPEYFEWDSGTIELVAEYLHERLAQGQRPA